MLCVALTAACGPQRGRGADRGPSGSDEVGWDAAGGEDAGGEDSGAAEPDALGGELDAGPEAPDTSVTAPACAPWAAVADAALRAELHALVQSTYDPIAPEPDFGGALNRYTTARHLMFTDVERHVPAGGGAAGVECVYTGRFVATGPDEEPDDGDVNCEHTWPRHRMDADRDGALYAHQQSDIHHLFPSDAGANSARGHLRFGEPVSDLDRGYEPALLGDDAAGERVFQPRQERQGDVARALLYYSVRWGAAIRDDEETVLRRWSADDAVDDRERAHNDAIAGVQGNRNPFIDCPSLVPRIADFADFAIADRDLALP